MAILNAIQAKRPNIIFILADDLGWAELGCYGNRFNETPHLDRLAKCGVRFTNAYASAPVCSPYRAALLTGQYPVRVGILDYLRPNSENGLSTDQVTLSERLREAGYATAMIGKWHLSGYRYHGATKVTRPTDHGFDWNTGSEVKGVGNGANFWPYIFRSQPIRWLDLPGQKLGRREYLTDRLNHDAVQFIERNRDKPFFLFLSHYAPHTILNGKTKLVAKYRAKHRPGKSTRERCYLCQDAALAGDPQNHWAGDHNPHLAAMLESIDDGVGRITAKLKALGLDQNTIVIFTSDNGGETNVTSNAPLRGGKSQLYEGGIRIPFIVSWPGVIPAGRMSHQPTSNIDHYPTLLAATGAKSDLRQKLDGTSLLSIWQEPDTRLQRRPLYWHYPLEKTHFLGGRSSGAIRDGDWKLIENFTDNSIELYDLANDPSEKVNLAGQRMAKRKAMLSQLIAWRKTIGATKDPPRR
ncbi:MAG: sulfatase [Verrucomicrobiota bacterium]|nr:sulfatase [Verrucomicrobiota bacterium]